MRRGARRQYKEGLVLTYMHQVADAKAAQGAAATAQVSSEELLDQIIASLEDDKAEGITPIDMRGKSVMADYMVVCTGRSGRQVVAISDKLADRLKQSLRISAKVNGKDAGDWVLIDAGDVVVHVFRPEVRDFYQIEKMWQSAPGDPAPDTA